MVPNPTCSATGPHIRGAGCRSYPTNLHYHWRSHWMINRAPDTHAAAHHRHLVGCDAVPPRPHREELVSYDSLAGEAFTGGWPPPVGEPNERPTPPTRWYNSVGHRTGTPMPAFPCQRLPSSPGSGPPLLAVKNRLWPHYIADSLAYPLAFYWI